MGPFWKNRCLYSKMQFALIMILFLKRVGRGEFAVYDLNFLEDI